MRPLLFSLLLSFSVMAQPKNAETFLGVIYYKNGSTVLIYNTKRSIIMTMNSRVNKGKLDSVKIYERGQGGALVKRYTFK